MNSRRSFLSDILKAGVSAMILPSAVTYAGRVWKKSSDKVFYLPIIYERDINLYHKLPFYLVELAKKQHKDYYGWEKLQGEIKWKPNMGSTMRGITIKPNPNWVNSQG